MEEGNSTVSWTEEEDELIKKYYPVEREMVALRLHGRSRLAVTDRAMRLNVSFSAVSKEWTAEEDAVILGFYASEGKEVRKRLPHRSMHSIIRRANLLGVKTRKPCKSVAVPGNAAAERVPGEPGGGHLPRWTEEEDDIIRKYYPVEGIRTAERLPHRSKAAVKKRAVVLGMHSDTDKGSYWTDEETHILKEVFPSEGAEGVYDRIGKRFPKREVSRRAAALGIKKKSLFTDEEREIIRAYYPAEGAEGVLRHMERDFSIRQINNTANKMGLHRIR